ncbi:MAG TPA: cbb3-type cytochrome c oxidase N-terminal domain-containing protein [Daejeonella sp.]|nr:cbb3-type cytochrome c oxidase N-terminal domain-containing protein [Daejeonella sp.]
MKRLIYLLPFLLVAAPSWAAETITNLEPANIFSEILIGVFILAAIVLLLVALALLRAFKVIAQELGKPVSEQLAQPERMLEYEEWTALEKKKPSIWNKILGLRPLSEEKDLAMEHTFDGITELDNPTPAWFMWLFYASIAFGVVYILNYHVFNWSPLQEEEYVLEMKKAEEDKVEYLAKAGNLIDENNVKHETDEAIIAAGKAVFAQNCVACHGDKGQGAVGPNLADEYWLHGGKVNNIFKTIKYGVPEKGMISWEKTLTPKQIADVSSYILSLQGTNPDNAKAPQGEKEG